MENKTAYAIVEALGEALVRKDEGVNNCLEHIGHLNAVQEKLIADNKKMKEEILSLKSESSAPVEVADTCCEPDCCENIGDTPYGVDG